MRTDISILCHSGSVMVSIICGGNDRGNKRLFPLVTRWHTRKNKDSGCAHLPICALMCQAGMHAIIA